MHIIPPIDIVHAITTGATTTTTTNFIPVDLRTVPNVLLYLLYIPYKE